MTIYNTGNPIGANGSPDPRDLNDNSQIADVWVTSRTKLTHPDRLGIERFTWYGMEQELNGILIAGGRIFDNEEQGRDAVGDGQNYLAVNADSNIAYTVWKRTSSSTSDYIADVPASEFVYNAITDISIYFDDEIVYDNENGLVTFPTGRAIKAGSSTPLIDFDSVTLAAPLAVINGATEGIAYYYYLDYDEPESHPIKYSSGASTSQPLQNGSLRKIGTIYRGSWNNSEFACRRLNQPRKFSTLLNTTIVNGNRDPRTPAIQFYGDSHVTSLDNAPFVDAPSSLEALGIEKAFFIEASQPLIGNFVDFPVFWKKDNKLCFFISITVYSTNGAWEYNNIGPHYYLLSENETGAVTTFMQGSLELLKEIDTNTRVYGLSVYPQSNVPTGTFFKALRIGMRATSTATDFYFGGFWISQSSGLDEFPRGVTLDETMWPQWNAVSAPTVAETSELPKPTSGLELLRKNAANPLHSLQVRLIGDSITWGTGAAGNSPSTPRSQSLSDPRNNLQARTWANLLRDYLGSLSCGVLTNRTDLGEGGSIDSNTVSIPPLREGIVYKHPVTGREFTPVKATLYPDQTEHGYTIDIRRNGVVVYNYGAEIEIDVVGDNLQVIFSRLAGDENLNRIEVFIDGVYETSFAFTGDSALFGAKSPVINFPFGKHKVTLRIADTSADNVAFRFEGVLITHKLVFWNDGIIGSNTSRWMPPTGLIVDAVVDSDEIIIVQLGTNNRAEASSNYAQKMFRDQLILIVEYLLGLGKKVILCASCVASVENESQVDGNDDPVYSVHMDEITQVIMEVANEYNIDFVNQYAATLQQYLEGQPILDDGLHPNDAGYKIMFDNIKHHLLNSQE